MAKYDRRLLVPYLQDVCSVELLLLKLKKEYNTARDNELIYKSRFEKDVCPQEPKKESGNWVLSGCIGAVLLLVAMGVFFGAGSMLALLGIPIGCVSLYFCASAIEKYKLENEYWWELDNYKRKLAAYNKRRPDRESNQQTMTRWNRRANILAKGYQEADALRRKIYEANVIPLPYRNIYAVHFLYDYFRSSQANDVDMILQTFVLEEIKSKLDRIIEQQTEIIISQREMIANQEKLNKTLAQNHEREMRQIANLNENAERRNQYLEMINTNLAVSNYFAYCDYIKH